MQSSYVHLSLLAATSHLDGHPLNDPMGASIQGELDRPFLLDTLAIQSLAVTVRDPGRPPPTKNHMLAPKAVAAKR